MSDIQGLDLEEHKLRTWTAVYKEIDKLNHRISELEDAMKTFIMRVNETKSRQDLLVAEATAITRFKELLNDD